MASRRTCAVQTWKGIHTTTDAGPLAHGTDRSFQYPCECCNRLSCSTYLCSVMKSKGVAVESGTFTQDSMQTGPMHPGQMALVMSYNDAGHCWNLLVGVVYSKLYLAGCFLSLLASAPWSKTTVNQNRLMPCNTQWKFQNVSACLSPPLLRLLMAQGPTGRRVRWSRATLITSGSTPYNNNQ